MSKFTATVFLTQQRKEVSARTKNVPAVSSTRTQSHRLREADEIALQRLSWEKVREERESALSLQRDREDSMVRESSRGAHVAQINKFVGLGGLSQSRFADQVSTRDSKGQGKSTPYSRTTLAIPEPYAHPYNTAGLPLPQPQRNAEQYARVGFNGTVAPKLMRQETTRQGQGAHVSREKNYVGNGGLSESRFAGAASSTCGSKGQKKSISLNIGRGEKPRPEKDKLHGAVVGSRRKFVGGGLSQSRFAGSTDVRKEEEREKSTLSSYKNPIRIGTGPGQGPKPLSASHGGHRGRGKGKGPDKLKNVKKPSIHLPQTEYAVKAAPGCCDEGPSAARKGPKVRVKLPPSFYKKPLSEQELHKIRLKMKEVKAPIISSLEHN